MCNLIKLTNNKVIVTVSYYKYYKKDYHTFNNCWDFYFELCCKANKKKQYKKNYIQKFKWSISIEDNDKPAQNKTFIDFIDGILEKLLLASKIYEFWIKDSVNILQIAKLILLS